jgi:hypothetical protein
MADATFDYVNLIITLPLGQTEVDVERDLYSAWKRSQQANDEPETGAHPAFRTIGGDPLTPGIDAGAYFFIRNDLGWRIKPAEADATVLITGNLAPEDSSVDILIPTTGDFSVLIAGLQPITQSVDTLLELQQAGSYFGQVVIDTVSGTSGTTYPTGQFQQPVDNLTDALAIAAANGLEAIIVVGNLTLDQTIPSGFVIKGSGGEIDTTITLNGQTVDKVSFTNVTLTGAGVGQIECELCSITNVSGVCGVFRQVGFKDTFTFNGGDCVFSYCYSEVAGTAKPVFDAAAAVAGNYSLRAYSGGFELRNATNVNFGMTIDCISASILIDSSCTAGDIVIRGVGDYTDNGTMNLTNAGFMEGGQLFTDVLDDPNGVEVGVTMREALRLILAATAGKVSGAAGTSITIRNAVADSKNRIQATVDASGNRTAITYDLSD